MRRTKTVQALLKDVILPDIVDEQDLARALHIRLDEAREIIRAEAIPGKWMGDHWYTTRWAVIQYVTPEARP